MNNWRSRRLRLLRLHERRRRGAGYGMLPVSVTTITRTDGSHQLTYNGHPLYTYIGDTAPGQASGNNLNLNGGLWHEVPTSR